MDSKIYKRLLELSENDPEIRSLLTIVESGVSYAETRAKTIVRYMDEYTLHDETHLYRVLSLMEKIIPDTTLNNLQALELSLLILSAFFHDLGMSPKEREIKIYKGLIDNDQELSTEEKLLLEDFNIYCETKIDLKQRIDIAYSKGNSGLAKMLENYRLTEYIRINHATKVKEIIQEIENNEVWSKGLKYNNFKFGRYLAKICESHNENILEINNSLIKTSIPVTPNEYLNSVFISIVLRLADILDFDAERTPDVLYNHLDIQNPISIQEWSKHRSIHSWSISEEQIMFAAECEHPVIEKTIKEFCKYIEEELYKCKIVLNGMQDRIRDNLKIIYNLPLPYKVDTTEVSAKVDYDGNPIYMYKDLNFNLDQEEIIKLLMGTSLYGNNSVVIRELIQNAIDACKVRSICSEGWGEQGYKPIIKINLYEEDTENYLEIIDNGIGMDENIILNYFSNLGKSYYKSEEFLKLKIRLNSNYRPISNFGIGFLSTFMVSNQVKVQTTKIFDKYTTSEPIELTIDSLSGLFYFNKSNIKDVGTKILLKLKKGHKFPLEKDKLKRFIENQINFLSDIEIYVNNELINVKKPELLNKDKENKSKYIKHYNLDINEKGILGTFRISLLEKDELFYSKIIVNNNYVNDNELFEYLRISNNSIEQESESLDIDGSINSGWSKFIATKGSFYLKSILVDDIIFRGSNFWRNDIDSKDKIVLPFPVTFIMNLDNESEMQLNLNAARDKIILDEKWNEFKYVFIKVLLENLLRQFNSIDKINSFVEVYGGARNDSELTNIIDELAKKRISELNLFAQQL
ncbi:HD domain-containing protein [Rummeliibacillus pycnus]|uniref:HD domain-containing protein n=1 Tax=Rummeliibacillus pycnus TaxID=101070 RepID=UPI001FE62CD1|nr:ATP-binding protein [Rummeliibacillus pycnus]